MVSLSVCTGSAVSKTAGNLAWFGRPGGPGLRAGDRSTGRLTVQSGRRRQRGVEHPAPVGPCDRGDLVGAEAAVGERVEQPRYARHVAELGRDRGAVEV